MTAAQQGQQPDVPAQRQSFLAHEIPDELGIPRVPDQCERYGGKMLSPDQLGDELLDAAESVEHLVQLAVWWHQSGRPVSNAMPEGGNVWKVLDALATAAYAGGIHEGCRAFSQIPPKGEWWDTSYENAPNTDSEDPPDEGETGETANSELEAMPGEITVEVPTSDVPPPQGAYVTGFSDFR